MRFASIAALDTARGDEDRGGDDGSGEGGQRRKPPKQVSLTDPQATWVARPGLDPFFAYDANYLIDNKVGIIIDAVALEQTEQWRLPLPRRWWTALSAASICGLRGSQATRSMARSGCSNGW